MRVAPDVGLYPDTIRGGNQLSVEVEIGGFQARVENQSPEECARLHILWEGRIKTDVIDGLHGCWEREK